MCVVTLLVFKYKNGSDSVLLVDQDDYDTCNKEKPIRKLENDGEYAKIKLDHTGPFFFISGYANHCEEGQKIVVLVMHPRGHGLTTAQPPAPAPAPTTHLTHSPAPAPAQAQATTPTPAPSPGATSSDNAESGNAAAFGVGGVTLLFCLLITVFVYGFDI